MELLCSKTRLYCSKAAALESLWQNLTGQQTNLKTIFKQLSSLIVRVDTQHPLMSLTTSSIPQPRRAQFVGTSRPKNV
jgi:hypothetical protein